MEFFCWRLVPNAQYSACNIYTECMYAVLTGKIYHLPYYSAILKIVRVSRQRQLSRRYPNFCLNSNFVFMEWVLYFSGGSLILLYITLLLKSKEIHETCNSHCPETHKAIQKYRGMFETQKSVNKTSSGEIGLNIRTLASPKVGQDQD